MLRRATILALLTLLVSVNARADITTGLIARYTFDGNATDVSGNGNNGTLVGGVTLTTDRFGVANRAYSFNGTDSYILISDSPSLDTPTTECTMAAWVYEYGLSNVGEHYNPLIMKSNDVNNAFMYRMIANPNYLGMSVNNWFNSQSVGQDRSAPGITSRRSTVTQPSAFIMTARSSAPSRCTTRSFRTTTH